METIYIYLFRNSHTEEHIDYMNTMLSCMEVAHELSDMDGTDRPDLNAWELKGKATLWAQGFLKHMSQCDMLHMTYDPIVD